MTNTSERGAAPNTYSRFIPREELDSFSAWRPHAFADAGGTSAGAGPAAADNVEPHAALLAARQAGYEDGYRDGLAALESFKQSFALQMTAQLAPLVTGFDQAFVELETQIAAGVAQTAAALARQVVRSELTTRPELVVQVASEAIGAVLLSARHIRVFVHPDELALVANGAGETLTARGARLLSDVTLKRGGCRIESDIGSVDASVEARWALAANALGQSLALHDAEDPA